jgi:hypothetical protein
MEQRVADMRRTIALQSQQANQRAIAALGEYNSINRDLTHLSVSGTATMAARTPAAPEGSSRRGRTPPPSRTPR